MGSDHWGTKSVDSRTENDLREGGRHAGLLEESIDSREYFWSASPVSIEVVFSTDHACQPGIFMAYQRLSIFLGTTERWAPTEERRTKRVSLECPRRSRSKRVRPLDPRSLATSS